MTEKQIKLIELGEYVLPPILFELENYITNHNLYTMSGFMISYSGRYNVTPLDAIPFARTGGAGIHFGFLTDFGNIKSLEHAPIVIIAPTDDPPIRLVAKNLNNFLSYFPTLIDAEDLLINEIDDWDRRNIERWDIYSEEEIIIEKQKYSKLANDFRNIFNGPKLNSHEEILANIQGIRNSRNSVVTIETADDIGIILNEPSLENTIIDKFDYSITDANLIENYLKSSSKSGRMQFYRNATYMYILSKGYDYEILQILKKWLKNDGFSRECEIINILDESIT